jgi:Mg2+/Co2+ transporter CorB
MSAFFSSAETAMLSLNRFRLKHLKRNGHRGAAVAHELLKRKDQLISMILIGNNFVNILASSIATLITLHFWGESAIGAATVVLTLVVLIFAEITPKTIAAYHPERIAFPAAFVLKGLRLLLFPVIWAINLITNGLLRLLGFHLLDDGKPSISPEELKTLVHESGQLIPGKHQEMLLGILDLERVTVNDIMIPRNEVVGIDIEHDMDEIIQQIRTSQHTRLPVYKGDINNVLGILHLRNMTRVLTSEEPSKSALLQVCRDPYFIPESTPLNTQLLHFQREKRRIGMVVDEYGDVLGLATMEDILEEIVGEFTTNYASASSADITPQADGSVLIDGTATVRSLNKSLGWKLPVDGPKTLNGLITEALETIPDSPVCLNLFGYRIEIRQIKDNVVKTARFIPGEAPGETDDSE